jgi:signal peptidase I
MKSIKFLENPETRSFLMTILLILFVRGHLVEPFKIPSGSMIPTILIGDHLFVSKSSYRIHIPFTNIEVLRVSEPKRSDVVVFEYPNVEEDPIKDGYYYIKRLIAIPGDRVKVVAGIPYINGDRAKLDPINAEDFPKSRSPSFEPSPYYLNSLETLPDSRGAHLIQQSRGVHEMLPAATERFRAIEGTDCIPIAAAYQEYSRVDHQGMGLNNICEFEVPEDKFFVMGDNRDDSSDGREWGFVSRELMVGKALFIWLSCKPADEGGGLCILPWNWRWNRLGLPMR